MGFDVKIMTRLTSNAIFRTHIMAICILIFISISFDFFYYISGHDYVFGLRKLFNVDTEMNIPSIFSAIAILCSSMLLFALHVGCRKSNMHEHKFFLFLGLIFLFLAYDEAFSVHEGLWRITEWSGLSGASGLWHYGWVIPGSIFVALIFFLSISFLRQTDAITRNLMVLSGAIFVGGAIGCEALAGLYLESSGAAWSSEPSIITFTIYTMEEALEMLGIALFIFTLLYFVEKYFSPFNVRLGRLYLALKMPYWELGLAHPTDRS